MKSFELNRREKAALLAFVLLWMGALMARAATVPILIPEGGAAYWQVSASPGALVGGGWERVAGSGLVECEPVGCDKGWGVGKVAYDLIVVSDGAYVGDPYSSGDPTFQVVEVFNRSDSDQLNFEWFNGDWSNDYFESLTVFPGRTFENSGVALGGVYRTAAEVRAMGGNSVSGPSGVVTVSATTLPPQIAAGLDTGLSSGLAIMGFLLILAAVVIGIVRYQQSKGRWL